jgi:CheY-like chemotaxis protein
MGWMNGLSERIRQWVAPPVPGHTSLQIQTIAVVGSPEHRPPLEDMVGAGAYRVLFVDEIEGAHSRIAQVMPDRVVLCCAVDDITGFQLLSMLKADRRTRDIPALTYLGAYALPDDLRES